MWMQSMRMHSQASQMLANDVLIITMSSSIVYLHCDKSS